MEYSDPPIYYFGDALNNMQVLSDFWVAEFLYSEYNDLKKNQTTVFWYSFIQNYQVKKISYLESLFNLKSSRDHQGPVTLLGLGFVFDPVFGGAGVKWKVNHFFRKWINLVQILLWIKNKFSFPGLEQNFLYFCY